MQLARLLREDARVDGFIATLSNEGALKPEVDAMGFTDVPEFKLTSFYDANFVRQIRRGAAFMKENAIDVVHTHDFYTNVFGMFAARLAGVKRRIASKRETGGMRSPAQKFVEKLAFRQSHKIVANSLAVRNYLVGEGVAPDKIEVVYNGLDLTRLTPAPASRSEILLKFGLPDDDRAWFVTLVANLRHAVKNQPMFIRAARIVVETHPNAHFVIAGEGELRDELARLADELGVGANVHLIGRCTDVPQLLSVSVAGVLSSFNEGFSNSILEYMAAGLPVVATNVGGAAEAIVDGETGFLVESDDSDALAARLVSLLSDEKLAVDFGSRGRAKVVAEFSLDAQLAKTLKLYGAIA